MSFKEYRKLETSSKVGELSKICNFVAQECQRLSFDKEDTIRLLTVVSEAVSNIMRHAYEGQDDKPIVIELNLYENKIVITFSDWGKEFNPGEVASPVFDGTREGGYGWFIINHYTDETHYCRNGDGKNTLTVVKVFDKKK